MSRTPLEIEGVNYPSISVAAKTFGLSMELVRQRIAERGWTPEQAVGFIPPPPLGHRQPVAIEGVLYPSMTAAAAAYGVNWNTVIKRITNLGWAPEQAVGLYPAPAREPRREPVTVQGRTFPSVAAACRHYRIAHGTVSRRIRHCNWSLEKALTTKPRLPKALRIPGKYHGRPKEIVVYGWRFASKAAVMRYYEVDAGCQPGDILYKRDDIDPGTLIATAWLRLKRYGLIRRDCRRTDEDTLRDRPLNPDAREPFTYDPWGNAPAVAA